MNIWVMRHGEAGFDTPSDHERTLTANGKLSAEKQGEWLAKRLINQGLYLDKILVSPYQRTQQTLTAVLTGMQAVQNLQKFAPLAEANLTKIVETWEGITPSGNPTNVLNYARFLREEGAKNLLIISHLPLVYELVEQFTQHRASVHFYPAVIAEIDWTTDLGTLQTTEYP